MQNLNLKIIAAIAFLPLVSFMVVVILFLPIRTEEQSPVPAWNTAEAYDDYRYYVEPNWVSDLEAGNYDCPYPSVEEHPVIQPGDRPYDVRNPRMQEFVRLAVPDVRYYSTIRERITFAAELAIDCQIFFGSCGRSVGAIYAIAGIGDYDDQPPEVVGEGEVAMNCLTDSTGGCDLLLPKRGVPPQPGDSDEEEVEEDAPTECMFLRGSNSNATICRNCSSGCSGPMPCIPGGIGAVVRGVRRDISLTDYPDRWTDHLVSGDWLYVYAGNTTRTGAHSIIFMGWDDEEEGWAWIYEGQYGPFSDQTEVKVRLNRKRLKGPRALPVIHVWSPEEEDVGAECDNRRESQREYFFVP